MAEVNEEEVLFKRPEAPPIPQAVLATPQTFETKPREHFEPVRLHFAINHDNLDEAKAQVKRGIDLDFVVHGNTPLMLSMLREQYNIAEMLVRAGADVTIPEIYVWRRQPIHLAARDGQEMLVTLLLEKGASLQAADGMLMTPLHWAAAHGHLDTVQVLLNYGAHVGVKDDRGRTPLFRAVASSHGHVVEVLRQEGASLNIQDIYGWSPLHQAVLCNLPIVPQLLALGADPNLRDLRGDTPLHLAVTRQAHHNLITLSRTDLQFYTRDLKITSTCTDHLKNFIKERDLLLALLDYGCDVNLRNSENKTALDVAILNGNVVYVKWLVLTGATIDLPAHSWPQILTSNTNLCEFLQTRGCKRVRCLKEMVRFCVRRHLFPTISENIQVLPLPSSLKQYLQVNIDL